MGRRCVQLWSRLCSLRDRGSADTSGIDYLGRISLLTRQRPCGVPSKQTVAVLTDKGALPLRVCRIVTTPYTFVCLLAKQLQHVAARGVSLTLVSSPGPQLQDSVADASLRHHAIGTARNPRRLTQMSARNFAVAREYREEILKERRRQFYQIVREGSWSPSSLRSEA